LRSGVDPVRAVRVIGRRVFGVHLKDVKGGDRFTPLGEGDLDIVGLLRVLNGLHYSNVMALEYEDHPENPIPDITSSLAAVRAAVLKI
ncbi:MAG: TIM barrel protein, partial [Chloroflexi bacterium]|nr:TIM barrel protein [Chloroflexota bacterium]